MTLRKELSTFRPQWQRTNRPKAASLIISDPAAGRQLSDEGAVEFAHTVIEILETRVAPPELRFLEPTCERAIVTRKLLGIDEHAQPLIEIKSA
jgi:hypothetical protein